MCILSVDIGTTALKAALVTHTGEVAAFSKQPLEQGDHAALGWMPALEAAMVAMLGHESSRYNFCPCSASIHPALHNGCGALGNPDISSKNHSTTGQRASASVVEWSRSDFIETTGNTEVSAIAISGNGPTLVAPDGTTLLWNASTPSTAYRGQRSIFLPRIAAFRAMHPNVWATLDRAHPLCSGPEFLSYQLTGYAVTVLPEARYMGAYWDDGRLDALGIPRDILPPFAPPIQQVGMYNGVPVFCTGPDFIAAMIGTGSLEAGRMYDCAGSSEGVNLVVSDPIPPVGAPPLRILPSVIPGLWNAAVIIPESGSIFVNYRCIVEAVADREVPYAELIDRSMARRDSDGYEILQYMAQNFRDAVNALPRVADCIVVTGGQARNARWMQMKADASGVPLAVMKCPDAELLGDAAAALVGLGVYPSLQAAAHDVCHVDKVYRPMGDAGRSVSRNEYRGESESL